MIASHNPSLFPEKSIPSSSPYALMMSLLPKLSDYIVADYLVLI